jgi:hypothetical protein
MEMLGVYLGIELDEVSVRRDFSFLQHQNGLDETS